MKNVFLVNYSVKGIKTLDQMVSLSFYKKAISSTPDTSKYNVKGIYGINGAGKSAIMTSVLILKKLLLNPDYLSDQLVQRKLEALINKKLECLDISVDYLYRLNGKLILFSYTVQVNKNRAGRYHINSESLSYRSASSHSDQMALVYNVTNGILQLPHIKENDFWGKYLIEQSKNLLPSRTLASISLDSILNSQTPVVSSYDRKLIQNMISLLMFGDSLYVYLEQDDDHSQYFIDHMREEATNSEELLKSLAMSILDKNKRTHHALSAGTLYISLEDYTEFCATVNQLERFIKIFKCDLKEIAIEKKEDRDVYRCHLIMVYDGYQIDSEFESTGIKKLIRLFLYIKEAACGGIVFIDEIDSNLHDVYLCALLEYLMEYSEGQLCFTTHNVGPMDILKKNKKSIDFLSIDHTVYPWTSNGNYSPSNLYRNGMIEGSPFNVDSIDFIGIFDRLGEEN